MCYSQEQAAKEAAAAAVKEAFAANFKNGSVDMQAAQELAAATAAALAKSKKVLLFYTFRMILFCQSYESCGKNKGCNSYKQFALLHFFLN